MWLACRDWTLPRSGQAPVAVSPWNLSSRAPPAAVQVAEESARKRDWRTTTGSKRKLLRRWCGTRGITVNETSLPFSYTHPGRPGTRKGRNQGMLFSRLVTRLYALRNFNVNHVSAPAARAVGNSFRPVIRPESMPSAEITSYKLAHRDLAARPEATHSPGIPQGGESPPATGPCLRAGQCTEPFPLSAVFTLCKGNCSP